jgi:hypothetical protein
LEVPEVADLGTVDVGTVVQGEVRLKNRSGHAVELWDFKRSCGCVALMKLTPQGESNLASEVVPPRDELAVRVRFVAYPGIDGAVRHKFSFRTNLPNQSEVVVEMRCQARVHVFTLPREIGLGVVRPGEPATTMAKIIDCRNPSSRSPLRLALDSGHVTASPISLSADSEDYADMPEGVTVYRVNLTALVPDGSTALSGRLTIGDATHENLCTTSFIGTVKPYVWLSPAAAVLPRHGAADPYRFRAVCRSELPCTIAAKHVPEGFHVRLNGNIVEVSCEANPPPSEGTRELVFEGKSADGKEHTLRLPVTVFRPDEKGPDRPAGVGRPSAKEPKR